MKNNILENMALLKKYDVKTHDYAEYPHKKHWSQNMGSEAYKAALKDWMPASKSIPLTLYVHTPFCPQLCYFCICSKEITRDYSKVKNYLLNYLSQEISMLAELFSHLNLTPSIQEIFLGGGSPTYYREEEFNTLIEIMGKIIDFDRIKDFTIEIDPRFVDSDRLLFYHKCGVNKLSFGIQDFDLEVQKEINRVQPPELIEDLMVPEIRSYFQSINFDILVGLPKQTVATMRETMEKALTMQPDRLTFTYVSYNPTDRPYMIRMNRNQLIPDFYDRKAMFIEGVKHILDAGYIQTGLEHFAKPTDSVGKASGNGKAVYGSLGVTTEDCTSILAVGSSAYSSFGEDYYFQNYYENNLYTKALDNGEFPIYRGHKLSAEDKMRRHIVKGIRTCFFIDVVDFENKYGIEFNDMFAKEIKLLKEFEEDGLVELNSRSLSLTDIGQHLSPVISGVFDSYWTGLHHN